MRYVNAPWRIHLFTSISKKNFSLSFNQSVAGGLQGGRAPDKRVARYREQIRRLKIKWTTAANSELTAREAFNEADEWRYHCEQSNIAAKIQELEDLCSKNELLVRLRQGTSTSAHFHQLQRFEAEAEFASLRNQLESRKIGIAHRKKHHIAAAIRLWREWDDSYAAFGPNLPPPLVPRPNTLHFVGNQIYTDNYYEAQQTSRDSLSTRLGSTRVTADRDRAAQAASSPPTSSQEEEFQDPEDSFIHFDD